MYFHILPHNVLNISTRDLDNMHSLHGVEIEVLISVGKFF